MRKTVRYFHHVIGRGTTPVCSPAELWQKFLYRPASNTAFDYLNTIASHGSFTATELNEFHQIADAHGLIAEKNTAYYLASLYLQTGDVDRAEELLSSTRSPSNAMRWYAALMIFADANGYDLPLRTRREHSCLDYLKERLAEPEFVVDCVLKSQCDVAIVGNAPGPPLGPEAAKMSSIFFNDYQKNQRLTNNPAIHVVTPSWDFQTADSGRHLFITGNNIFHRRSQVWRRFKSLPHYETISCFPKEIWSSLYQKLEAPPSAGLLMIDYLSRLPAGSPTSLVVAGFSRGRPQKNHDFDNVPASARHNWHAETLLRSEAIERLVHNGFNVSSGE